MAEFPGSLDGASVSTGTSPSIPAPDAGPRLRDSPSKDGSIENGAAVEDPTKKTRASKRKRKAKNRVREKNAMLMAAEQFEAAISGAMSSEFFAISDPSVAGMLPMATSLSPFNNSSLDDFEPMEPDELGNFLRSRPPLEHLKQLGILRDPEEQEARRSALSTELSKLLQHRPTQEELLGRHVIHYSMQADPGLMATLDAVTWRQTIDHLSRRLRDRATLEDLSRRGVRVVPTASAMPFMDFVAQSIPEAELNASGGSGNTTQPGSRGNPDARRAAALTELQSKLSHRPSLQDLMQSQVIKDVMMWTKVELASMSSPQARNCHSMSLVGRHLVLLGGYAHPECTCQPLMLALDSSEWRMPSTTSAASFFPQSRYAHSAVNLGRFVMVFGGYGESQWLNDVWLLDIADHGHHSMSSGSPVSMPQELFTSPPAGNGHGQRACRWYLPPITGSPPPPRAAHSAVCRGDTMVVFGGNDGTGLFNDVHALRATQGGCSWHQPLIIGAAPAARSGHTAVLHGAQMIVFGGGEGWGSECFNDLFVLDCETRAGAWTWLRPAFTGLPPSPRTGHACCIVSDKMFVFGGGDARKSFNDLHILDVRTMSWSRPSDTGALPGPRAGMSLTAVAPYAVMFGGATPDGNCFNDLVVLDTEYNYYGASQRDEASSNAHIPTPLGYLSAAVPIRTELPSGSLHSSVPVHVDDSQPMRPFPIRSGASSPIMPSDSESRSAFRRTSNEIVSPTGGLVSPQSSPSASSSAPRKRTGFDVRVSSTAMLSKAVAATHAIAKPPAQAPQVTSIAVDPPTIKPGDSVLSPGRPRSSRIAEIASNFASPPKPADSPQKPLPGRLGISWPPPRAGAPVPPSATTNLPAALVSGSGVPSNASSASKTARASRSTSFSDIAASPASGDPIAALSFVRSMITQQQREDEGRYRQMQHALEEWKKERNQQAAALTRIIDKVVASAVSGNLEVNGGRNAYYWRGGGADALQSLTPSSAGDGAPHSGAGTPDRKI